MSFPKDFLWGSASAAYQIEGAANIDGKGLSIWDEYSHIKGNTFKDTNGDVAIDFYHRFEEDIELMKEMGLKAYRFSISWPRIMPLGKGEVNQEGLAFYHRVIDKLISCNIEPILTIYHWDLPKALQDEYQGWQSREIIQDFTNYCEVLYDNFNGKVKYWVTLNEQNIFTSLGYLLAIHPPKQSDFNVFMNVNHIANLANASAIALFRKKGIKGLIGPSFAYGPAYAKSSNPLDILASEDAMELQNYLWLDVYAKGKYSSIQLNLLNKIGVTLDIQPKDNELLLQGIPDFMGINYYSSVTYSKNGSETKQMSNTMQSQVSNINTDVLYKQDGNEFLKTTDWNWIIDPMGLRIAMRRISSRYDLPILITENGLGAYDELKDGKVNDDYRISYLKDHIVAIEDAISDGVNVLGYCTWSFQDLFSWLNGYAKRYGFVYVDRDENDVKEMARYKKDSFYWYAQVIKNNGLDK